MAYPANGVWNVLAIQLLKYGIGKLYLGFDDAGASSCPQPFPSPFG
jgi:hypothetical protein